MDIDAVNQLIRRRRTIKPANYADTAVPRESIELMLENANWAPNHGKTQPWRFQVLSGGAKDRLADHLVNLYKTMTPEEDQLERKIDNYRNNAVRAQYVIGIIATRTPSKGVPPIEDVEATAMAVQNMYLTATALGLGVFWSTGLIAYRDEMRDFFGVTGDEQFLGILYVGNPAGEWPEGNRKPLEDRVEWVEQ